MNDYLDDLDYLDSLEDSDIYWQRTEKIKRKSNPKHDHAANGDAPARDKAHANGFNPTFSSSRHEREWILTYLSGFYDDQLITDVLRQVKGGTEAQVYCC